MTGLAVISRHNTSQGTVVYARRPDGGLQVWLVSRRQSQPQLLTEGGPTAPVELVA